VCDCFNNRVVVFNLDGSFVRQWGSVGSGDGQFNLPYGVVVNGDEVLITDNSNHSMQVFGLDGVYKRQWGGEGDGAGQFNCPMGIAVSEGEVFVASDRCMQVFR
jgi:DNA-binding beta-propeller fold protein YncE